MNRAGAVRAVFSYLPELEGRVPWLDLGVRATPVDRLTLDDGSVVWVKRDDRSAEPYGGNKVRKLEFVLAAAREQGARRLITAGALGSHHALATALYGRRIDLPSTAVLFPQPVTPHVREVVAAQAAAGTILRLVRRMEMVPMGLALARWGHRAERPFVVPPGGSSVAGTLGFVSAGLELAEQIGDGECARPAAVYVPAGTLGSVVGLAVGFAIAGVGCTVVAVRVVGSLVTNRRTLRRLTRATLAHLASFGIQVPPARRVLAAIEWRSGEVGPGYGIPTEAGDLAIERFRPAGIVLDPTYTAKAAAALLHDLGRGRAGPLLFWHTLSSYHPEEHPEPGTVLPREVMALLGSGWG